jgi:hypothetical protein
LRTQKSSLVKWLTQPPGSTIPMSACAADAETVSGSITETVASLMPQLRSDLARLVAIPSVSVWGFPEHTRPALPKAHDSLPPA